MHIFNKHISLNTFYEVEFSYFTEAEQANVAELSFLGCIFFGDFKERYDSKFVWQFDIAELALFKDFLAKGKQTPARIFEPDALSGLDGHVECARYLCDENYTDYLVRSIIATCEWQGALHFENTDYPDEFITAFPKLLSAIAELQRDNYDEIYTDLFYVLPNLTSFPVDMSTLTRLDFGDETLDLSGKGTVAFTRCCAVYDIPLNEAGHCNQDAMGQWLVLGKAERVRCVSISPIQHALNLESWPWEKLSGVTVLCMGGEFNPKYEILDLLSYLMYTPNLQFLHLGDSYSDCIYPGTVINGEWDVPVLGNLTDFGVAGQHRLSLTYLFLAKNPTVTSLDLVDFNGADFDFMSDLWPLTQVRKFCVNATQLNVLNYLFEDIFPAVVDLSIKSGVLPWPIYILPELNLTDITHLELSVRRMHPRAFSECLRTSASTLQVLKVFSGKGADPLTYFHLDVVERLPELRQIESGSYAGNARFLSDVMLDYISRKAPRL